MTCHLCDDVFTRALGKNPVRHCKRCGRSVCGVCSESKRQLSQNDPTQYRVCDKCDTDLDNFKLQRKHKEVMAEQLRKIEFLNEQIVQLDNEKEALHANFEQEAERQRGKLEKKKTQMDALNEKVEPLRAEITKMSKVRDSLLGKISDLERVLEDMQLRQVHITTKQQKVLAEASELQAKLSAKNLMDDEL